MARSAGAGGLVMRLSRSGRAGLVVSIALLGASAAATARPELGAMCPFPEDLAYDASTCSVALAGLWTSLVLGVSSAAIAMGIALVVAVGLRAVGGAFDALAVRIIDGFFALPDVLVILVAHLAIVTLAGPDAVVEHPMIVMIGSLALVSWTGPARILRDHLETLERRDFVQAATALGASRARVLAVHLRPFLAERALVLFLQRVPAIILAESIVSYIGIGNPDLVSLGRYLAVHGNELAYASPFDHVVPAWVLLAAALLSVRLVANDLSRRERGDRRRAGASSPTI